LFIVISDVAEKTQLAFKCLLSRHVRCDLKICIHALFFDNEVN
jgi:hypothetical protein